MSKEHDSLLSVHPFAVIDDSDPGAIGKRKGWLDTSVTPPRLKYRNEGDTDWVEIVDDGTSMKLLQKTVWDVRFDVPVLTVPAGKNAVIDKICVIALGDINEEVGGAELDLIDTFTNTSLFDYLAVNNQWDNFAGSSGGMVSTGVAVTFKGWYDKTSSKHHDFPIIAEGIDADCTVTPAEAVYVLVLVYGQFIDNIYI